MADPWRTHDWQPCRRKPRRTACSFEASSYRNQSRPVAASAVEGTGPRAGTAAGFLSGVTGVGGGVFLTRCLSCSAEPRRDTRPRSHLSSSSAIQRPALQGFRLPGRHSRRAPSFLGGALVGTGGYRHRHRTTLGCRSAPRTTRVASVYDRFGIQPILSTFGDEKGAHYRDPVPFQSSRCRPPTAPAAEAMNAPMSIETKR